LISHDHVQPVKGCFRCELSADEARDDAPPGMPFDTFDIEVTLIWSHQKPNGDVPYLGDAGEETRKLTDYALHW
jgi:hypothetical protein